MQRASHGLAEQSIMATLDDLTAKLAEAPADTACFFINKRGGKPPHPTGVVTNGKVSRSARTPPLSAAPSW